jgi:hypothetical protein
MSGASSRTRRVDCRRDSPRLKFHLPFKSAGNASSPCDASVSRLRFDSLRTLRRGAAVVKPARSLKKSVALYRTAATNAYRIAAVQKPRGMAPAH